MSELPRPSPPRILAVDDTASVLAFIRSVLEPEGYRVFVATSGEACLERLALVDPDLVLLDIMMPGLDGWETCRRIKALAGASLLPVIFLSTLGGGFDKARAFEAGAADYVTKPVDPLELLARVKAQLGMRELEQRRREGTALLERAVAERTAELEAALEEREGLLRELSHRVENNLQVLLSIIRQQAALGDGPGALDKLYGRVETMALVYEQLSSSRRTDGIAMEDYLREIVLSVLSSRPEQRLAPDLDLSPLVLSLDRAMPCGLIVNELVMNSALHAYGPEGGPIGLSLRVEGGECVLEVWDGGRGCKDSPEEDRAGGLGRRVVEALTVQLQARLLREPGAGCRYSLRFPLGPETRTL